MGGGTNLQDSCIDQLRSTNSINYSILVTNKNMVHRRCSVLQMTNNPALEKIYCMLILLIRAFWPPES